MESHVVLCSLTQWLISNPSANKLHKIVNCAKQQFESLHIGVVDNEVKI
jgi:hypothetical protein